jgi:hypothetical protein
MNVLPDSRHPFYTDSWDIPKVWGQNGLSQEESEQRYHREQAKKQYFQAVQLHQQLAAYKGKASKGGGSKGSASKNAGKRKAEAIAPKAWGDMDLNEQWLVDNRDYLKKLWNDANASGS